MKVTKLIDWQFIEHLIKLAQKIKMENIEEVNKVNTHITR